MADANVIFKIGSSLGPGGLASLQAGVQMVAQLGRMVANAIKETDKYSVAYSNLQVSISEAEKATKGLIDTTELIVNANRFAAAGFEVTEKQLADVAKVAVEFAKKTGTDATAAMNDLTKAITTGRTSGLRKYGIDVKSSTDLQKLFNESMDQAAEKAEGVSIKLETVSEKFFSLKNNVGTASGNLGHFFNITGKGRGVLDLLIDSTGELNTGFENIFDLFSDMGEEFADAGSLMVGTITEVQIALFDFLGNLPFVGDSFEAEAKRIEEEQNDRLKRMRANEQEFQRRTGRSSVQVGGGREGAGPGPGPGPGPRRPDAGSAAAGPEITDEELLARDPSESQQADIAGAELLLELEQQRLDLRSKEISQQLQMRDIQMEMQELSAAGVDVEAIQSDFGIVATEENNELKEQKLDMIETELNLLREMNAEKIQGLEKQKKTEKELTKVQAFGATVNNKAFTILGRTAGAYFESVISGTAMSAEAAKNMIADLAKQEAAYYAIQAIIATGKGIFAAATQRYDLAAQYFTSAATMAVGAVALGGLAAALGGGGGGGSAASAPSAAVPGASGAPTETVSSPSAGGGGSAEGTQEITVILQGDADRMFEVIRSENINRRRHSLATLEDQ